MLKFEYFVIMELLLYKTDMHNYIKTKTLSRDYNMGQNLSTCLRKNLSSVFANNKGAGQPAQLRSLISAFVIVSYV